MDAPAGSDSSGGKMKTKPRTIISKVTPLRLEDPNLDSDLSIGVLTLDKPSGVPSAPNWKRQVCLDLTDPNDNFSLSIMKGIHHKNILHLESVLNAGSSVKFCVERYSKSLYHVISKYRYANHIPKLQDIIRQMIEGIEELRLNDLYHGNLSLYTTYYDMDTGLVKLANFKEKDDSHTLMEAQLSDWHGLGNVLENISTVMQRRHMINVTSLLDDLASQLKKLSPPRMLCQVKDETLDHVFFWNRDRRSSFYTYGIIGALHRHDFKTMVANNLDFIPEDWNNIAIGDDVDRDASDLLDAMNRYRRKNKINAYNRGRHQFVLFVSGAYTHEDELDIKIDVDDTVEYKYTCLCLVLVRIVRQLGYNV